MNHRRNGEAAQRFAERRQREDEAPRLRVVVPRLSDFKLEVEERRSGGVVAETSHIRRVVVDHAPALFILPCGDPSCKDGGHDVTHGILRSLERNATRFEGEDVCSGNVGTATCGRVLKYVGIAVYRDV
jgi:hypothetical protein